jgi:capsular exopolysaccharide synthesis family protein
MSKIFNVIKNYNLADFGEPGEPEQSDAGSVLTAAAIDTIPHPSSPVTRSDRYVRLRIPDSSPIFPFDAGQQEAAEQYRIIRTKLLHHPKQPRLLVVSSASSGDGKTVTTINLAASLALKQNSPVLLVDADLRRPRIANLLGISATPGLAEILSGSADLEAALVRTEEFPGLYVLPAGAARTGAAELLDSPNWKAFIERIRSRFSSVLFDAPPIALVADYELIQLACDGAIVVIRPNHSGRAACLKALEIVPRDKLLGVVLNCYENWWLWKADSYSYYR